MIEQINENTFKSIIELTKENVARINTGTAKI